MTSSLLELLIAATNPLFYNVLSLEALLSDVVMGKELDHVFYWRRDRLDMNRTRKLMNHQWWSHIDKNKNFDTVLALTGAQNFSKGSVEDDYGISGLGGVCCDGERSVL